MGHLREFHPQASVAAITPAMLEIEADHPWLLDLDFTDLLGASQDEIQRLVDTAPTTAAQMWLCGYFACRINFNPLIVVNANYKEKSVQDRLE